MTAVPALLADLNGTTDPRRRATALNDLADAHELAGMPVRARLLRLIADTESLLDDPAHEVEDDDAWDIDHWWRLANTSNRHQRAELLTDIWRDWALTEFGDDADALLQVAETERAAAAVDLDTILAEHQETLLANLEEGFDAEAGLADLCARAAQTPRDNHEADDREEPPSTAVRDVTALIAKAAGIGVAAIAAALAVICVAAPQTPHALRFGCAVALAMGVLAWFGAMWGRSGR